MSKRLEYLVGGAIYPCFSFKYLFSMSFVPNDRFLNNIESIHFCNIPINLYWFFNIKATKKLSAKDYFI